MSIASIVSQGSPVSSYLSLAAPTQTPASSVNDSPSTSPFIPSVVPVGHKIAPSANLEDLEKQQRHHLQQFYYFQQLAIERYNKAQEQSLKEQKEIEDIFKQYSFGDNNNNANNDQEDAITISNTNTLDPASISKSISFPRESSTSLARVPSLVASSPSSSGSEANLSFEDLVMQAAQPQQQQHNQYGYGIQQIQNRPLPYVASGGNSNYSVAPQYGYAQNAYGQQVSNGNSYQGGYPVQQGDLPSYQANYNVGIPMQTVSSQGQLSSDQLANLAASGGGQYGRHNYASLAHHSAARDMVAAGSQPVLGPYANATGPQVQMYYRSNGSDVGNLPLSTTRTTALYQHGTALDVKREAYSPPGAAARVNNLTGSPIPEDNFAFAHQQPRQSGKVSKKVKRTSNQAPYMGDRRHSALSQATSGESSIVTVVALNGPESVNLDELPENVRNPLGGGRGYVPGETPDDPSKRHHCGICGRGFARLYNLKSHAQTHDPERPKPHDCPHATCKKSFSRLHDLERHRQGIHNDGPLVDAKRQGVTPALARAQHRIIARAERGDLI